MAGKSATVLIMPDTPAQLTLFMKERLTPLQVDLKSIYRVITARSILMEMEITYCTIMPIIRSTAIPDSISKTGSR